MTPTLSVVLSVFNDERYVFASVNSVLTQTGIDLELIAVNDGSTDGSGRMLDELAKKDRRVRVLHQENQGLTKALIQGCNAARGRFIARQDADDRSLPGRLVRQVQLLESDLTLTLASCWSVTVGPNEEELFRNERCSDPDLATAAFLEQGLGPPGHGSVLFRRADYEAVGGYRAAFRVAQDWDLWLRLLERGRLGYVADCLYAYRVQENSISSLQREQQVRLATVARHCRQARLEGASEQPYLNEASRISAELLRKGGDSDIDGAYFIGKCLLDRRDRRALKYLGKCVRQAPCNWRHWIALIGAAVECRL